MDFVFYWPINKDDIELASYPFLSSLKQIYDSSFATSEIVHYKHITIFIEQITKDFQKTEDIIGKINYGKH